MNPTSPQAARYQGGFFASSIGSADNLLNIALHSRGKPRGIRAPAIKKTGENNTFRVFSPAKIFCGRY